jgi:hypothetical protein
MMPALGGQMKSPTLLHPTHPLRFRDVVTNCCVLDGIKDAEGAYKFSTDNVTYDKHMRWAKGGIQELVFEAIVNAKKWEAAVPKIQVHLKKLIEEDDAEQHQRDAGISHRNSLIQQLKSDNANAEKASEKATTVKEHLMKMQNELANGCLGMHEVQVEAAKARLFIDPDL